MNAKELGNLPAYAYTKTKQLDRGRDGYEYKDVIAGGITLRQHFAGLAMQGILSALQDAPMKHETVARVALRNADALLRELAKET